MDYCYQYYVGIKHQLAAGGSLAGWAAGQLATGNLEESLGPPLGIPMRYWLEFGLPGTYS